MIVEGIDDLEYVIKKIGEERWFFEDEVLGVRSECAEILSGESVLKRGFVKDVECEV